MFFVSFTIRVFDGWRYPVELFMCRTIAGVLTPLAPPKSEPGGQSSPKLHKWMMADRRQRGNTNCS